MRSLNMMKGKACRDTKLVGRAHFPKVFDGTFNAPVDVTPLYIGARLQVFTFLLFLKTPCLLQSCFYCASANLAL